MMVIASFVIGCGFGNANSSKKTIHAQRWVHAFGGIKKRGIKVPDDIVG